MNRILSLTSVCFGIALSFPAVASEIDWSSVDTIMTRKASVSGDVHRYGLPRSDLSVSLDGITLKPASPSVDGSPSNPRATSR